LTGWGLRTTLFNGKKPVFIQWKMLPKTEKQGKTVIIGRFPQKIQIHSLVRQALIE
jgi:hypothetical protein